MGTITRSHTFVAGEKPTDDQWNVDIDQLFTLVNGNLDEGNVDYSSSDGIVTMQQTQTITGTKTFDAATTFNTSILPDSAGAADIGTASAEWGDVYIADDKFVKFGSDQNVLVGYDETTTDSLKFAATEGAGLAITLMADEGDDAGDEWKLNVADGGVITLGNDIASAGSYVTHLTLTPHATVSSSTLALAGALTVAGTAGITGVATVGGLTIGSAVINEAELETIDGVTAGTVAASKAVVVDSNKDIGSFRNVTLTGELDAATGDFSGDVDVDGTLEADAITLGGTALGSLYSPIAGSSSIVTVGTIGTGTWQGTAVASAYLDADTAHLSTTQTFTGDKTFTGTVTVGVDDTGKDVKFFGASAGAYMEWDESADQLRLMGASADATTSTGKLLLATSLTDINANDVLGKIDFQAPHEAGGTDAITIAASIQAIAQGTFSASVNATDLIFYTGHSEAATEKFRFTSQGELGIGGANYGNDGQVLTSTGAGTAPAWETPASSGATLSGSTDNTIATVTGANALQGEANLKFTGSALTCIGTVTVGVDDTGHDVKFFGATSGKYMEWDESADQLNVLGTALLNSGSTKVIAEFTSSNTNRMVVISADTETANDTAGIAFNATASQAVGSTHSIAAIEGKVTQAGTLKGDLIFHTNAGDSYTEGMRLDSAQRLGVGCDDPSTYGAVNSTSDSIVIGNTSSGNGNLTIANTTSGNGRIAFTDSADNTNQAYIRYDHNTNVMDFAVNGLGEVWRFANTGELTASHRSSMTDITYFNINTSTVETSNPKVVLASNSSTDNHLPNGEIRIHQEASVGSQYCVMTYTQSSSNTRKMEIRGDGDLGNANNTYGGISDAKLKQDITDARSYWDDLKSLQFKKFRFKTDVEEDANAPYKFGLIAQEVEPIFPGIVSTRQDNEIKIVPVLDDEGNPTYEAETDDDGNKIPITKEQTTMLDTTTKSIKYSVLSQIGLKVVQELQTRLEAAEAKIAALESA